MHGSLGQFIANSRHALHPTVGIRVTLKTSSGNRRCGVRAERVEIMHKHVGR